MIKLQPTDRSISRHLLAERMFYQLDISIPEDIMEDCRMWNEFWVKCLLIVSSKLDITGHFKSEANYYTLTWAIKSPI